MGFQPGNQEAKKANHKKPRIITQKLIARLQDAEGAELDKIIGALVAKAGEGDVPALKEIFDRVEGKVPQAISGDEENPLNVLHKIETVIVDPKARDS